ncbi:hypothetical protein G3863_005049 [Escherichia coli]|nr:hypothetical protein [Escherichia coli]
MLARTVKPSVLDIPHWGKSWLHPSHLRTVNKLPERQSQTTKFSQFN